MSRYCGEIDAKPILKAAEHWKHSALLSNGSVFGTGQLWISEHLDALDKNFVNQLEEGEGDFFQKLESQLQSTGLEVKQLAAEMLWLMLLCPSNISAAKKHSGIETIWNWSQQPFPADSPWLTDETLAGVGSAGTAFNTNRWRELVFFIRLMISFKKFSLTEREALLNNGWKFSDWLATIPEGETRQLRHMLLFLLFPDNFERIFSGGDRRKIVSAFTGKPIVQLKKLAAVEIDRMLADIRLAKEAEYDTKELDFYVEPLRALWGDKNPESWLFSWNPKHWQWAKSC